MKRMALGLAILALAGCEMGGGKATVGATGGLPAGYSVADHPIPPEVMAAVPADTALTDIIAYVDDSMGPGGPCYYYRRDGKLYPATTAGMAEGGLAGKPYCIM